MELRKIFSVQNQLRFFLNAVLFFTFAAVGEDPPLAEPAPPAPGPSEGALSGESADQNTKTPQPSDAGSAVSGAQNNEEQIKEQTEELVNVDEPQTAQDSQEALAEQEDASAGRGNLDDKIQLKIKSGLSPYIYDPSNKKNPFSKPKALEFKAIETDPKNRLHPVEFESLNSLKLRAIIQGEGGITPRALFETADRQTYTLTKNDRLGMEGAVIHRIDSDRVWAMKPFIDPNTGQRGFEPTMIEFTKERKNTGDFYYER